LKYLLLFHFIFASFHFRFVLDAKQANKHFFQIEAKKIYLPFRLISLRSENDSDPYLRLGSSDHVPACWDIYDKMERNHNKRVAKL
jgi:hypothetical protein